MQTSDHEGGELTGLTYREMREHSAALAFCLGVRINGGREKVKLLILLDMSIPIGECRLVVIMTSPLGRRDLGVLLRLSKPLIH